MVEIFVIIIVLAGLVILPWLGQIAPDLLLVAISILLNLINLAMTAINCVQAWRRDARFLSAGVLGAVQAGVGFALLAAFGLTLGSRIETWLSGVPFVIGGFIVLIAHTVAITAAKK